MSARKKVNQSRPRALARATASRVAGALCCPATGDTTPVSARRPNRPPSNSNASADSPIPPAPQGNYAASVLTDCPAQSATPRLLRRPTPTSSLTRDVAVVPVRVKVRKGGNFEKPPVSSMQIGIMRRRNFHRQPRQYGTFASGGYWARRPERAIHPPIHLVTHLDEPIRALKAHLRSRTEAIALT